MRDLPDPRSLVALSREFALLCEGDGTLRWCDERASRLGFAAGASLTDYAASGGEEKIHRMLESDAGDEWQLILQLGGGDPTTADCRTARDGDALVIVGCVASARATAASDRVMETMAELSAMHRESERQQSELRALNTALDDSGRGMKALYLELGEQADSLRVATESKSRFFANMSHELRTPLNSIVGLANLLTSRVDGELTPEQERQIGFIRTSAASLSDLVDDILDLSKLEAGRLRLRAATFEVSNVFASLRGMLRPLAPTSGVALVFEEPRDVRPLDTDEGKVQQILRNLLTNALKFTEKGEVRLSARENGDGTVSFVVRDTGIGIADRDRERVFEEFVQIDSALQSKVKGTGLGLSVSRRLARFLGGRLEVESAPGRGSTFTLTIPATHPEAVEIERLEASGRLLDPTRTPVLVVEDDARTLFLYEKYLQGSGFQVVPARSVDDARAVLDRMRPAAIVLDVMLDGESTWNFLSELKRSPATRDIPALVVTIVDREHKARALGADEFYVKPIDKEWLLQKLRVLASRGPMEKILVIDDDEVSRYLVRRILQGTTYEVLEAPDGPTGVRVAQHDRPHLILLDFVLPDMTAFEVLDQLKLDPETRNIPVIVHTAKYLDEKERARLSSDASDILFKQNLSREVAITRIREALAKSVVFVPTPDGEGVRE